MIKQEQNKNKTRTKKFIFILTPTVDSIGWTHK